jgi:hypothetical protein
MSPLEAAARGAESPPRKRAMFPTGRSRVLMVI